MPVDFKKKLVDNEETVSVWQDRKSEVVIKRKGASELAFRTRSKDGEIERIRKELEEHKEREDKAFL